MLQDLMHTIEKGDLSVAMITACFLRKQYIVLKPLSEKSRYDLVIDRGTGFERVQCKTGRLRNGSIVFATCSSTLHHKNGARKNYKGQIEWFAVYCHELDKCYLVSVNEVGDAEASLRVEPPKGKQTMNKTIRLAKDYEI